MLPQYNYTTLATKFPSQKELDFTLMDIANANHKAPRTQGKIKRTANVVKEILGAIVGGLSLVGIIYSLYILMYIFA